MAVTTRGFLIDPEIAKFLLDRFESELELPLALYEVNRREFITFSSNFGPFCTNFRQSSKNLAACEASHYERAVGAKTLSEPTAFACHVALYNMSCPIRVDGNHVATILCGQRLLRPHVPDSHRKFQDGMAKLGISPAQQRRFERRYDQIPVVENSNYSEAAIVELRRLSDLISRLIEDRLHLQHEVQSRTRRVNNVAHEFLLPIQGIVAAAKNISSQATDPTPDMSYIQDASRRAKNLATRLYFVAENMRHQMLTRNEPPYELRPHGIESILFDCWEVID